MFSRTYIKYCALLEIIYCTGKSSSLYFSLFMHTYFFPAYACIIAFRHDLFLRVSITEERIYGCVSKTLERNTANCNLVFKCGLSSMKGRRIWEVQAMVLSSYYEEDLENLQNLQNSSDGEVQSERDWVTGRAPWCPTVYICNGKYRVWNIDWWQHRINKWMYYQLQARKLKDMNWCKLILGRNKMRQHYRQFSMENSTWTWDVFKDCIIPSVSTRRNVLDAVFLLVCLLMTCWVVERLMCIQTSNNEHPGYNFCIVLQKKNHKHERKRKMF